ncbi:retrovirus-related pol polyprotein from transposon TNT 1-94 [Tanacetum coccineum]
MQWSHGVKKDLLYMFPWISLYCAWILIILASLVSSVIVHLAGKENGEILKDSVINGPYKFKSEITTKDTDDVTDICHEERLEDLKGDDKLCYDSDIKAGNILLLRLPFTSELKESFHSYYLRYVKMINDMNMIPMSMTPMQINTKFVNHLQPEWSMFVTAAKQARDLHNVTFDQLYAFLKHKERDAKEVREMRKRFPELLALLANTYNPPPSYNIVQQPPTFQPDIGLAIPTFLSIDDPIANLNKAMIFLSSVYRSKFPPTNNQLRISSNPRTQATIQKGQVTVQNVQGRQSQGYAGNARNNQALGARVINAVGNTRTNQPRVIRCYNCNGEGHMAKQCTARKRVKDSEWFKDKMLLAQAQEAGVLQATTNFKADHVDAYDSDYDDEATTNAIFMANLSPVGSLNDDTIAPRYDSDTLSEVPHYDTYHDFNVLNSNIQELGYIENIVYTNESYDELKGNIDVISYTDYMLTIGNDEDNYVPPHVQKNDMMLFVIET